MIGPNKQIQSTLDSAPDPRRYDWREVMITKVSIFAVMVLFLTQPISLAGDQPGRDYTMKNEPSGEYYNWKKTKKPERPWLLPYHQTLVTKIFLCSKNGKAQRGKISTPPLEKKVYLTFAEALTVIQKFDNITAGIPKVTYLVGWQFDGHDSKYPSWAKVNNDLKRAQDKTAFESLRWLIREGRKYNTTVSLHLNMFDAYEDSPLWDTYIKHDIIGKDKQGNVIFGEVHGGQRSAQISYTQEWKRGFAQKRINDLIKMIPELRESKTIHVDAFHSARPLDRKAPISPLLGYSQEEEASTQRKIYRYWRTLGFDVTSEGAGFLRPDAFVGLQPMAWANEGVVRSLPNELYCSTPMRAEPEIQRDPHALRGLQEQFCLNVLSWHYNNNKTSVKGRQKMRDGNDICMPALWKKEKTLIAYSSNGYESKTWELPPDWKNVKAVTISQITLDGSKPVGEVSVSGGKLTLSMKKGEALAISLKK